MKKQYKIAPLSLAIASICLSPSLFADEVLDTIEVKAYNKIGKQDKDVTGLGRVIKTSEQLNKDQVIGIRDATRYDPGISVVEQGNGASTGYSIRGVDKNRVAISVDGIPQIQSYVDPTQAHSTSSSGAINEIEYENVSAIEFAKGSDSAYSGSGAMGGSVNFATKDVDDFIIDDKSWGLTSKSVYSSKDKRFGQTVGGAFRHNGFEGLIQYTGRKGHEISIHPDAEKATQYQIQRYRSYERKYDLLAKIPNTLDGTYDHSQPDKNNGFYVSTNGCSAATLASCTDEHIRFPAEESALSDPSHIALPAGRTEPWTPEELEQIRNQHSPVEYLSPKEYTGKNRIAPNPMEYKTGSMLVRLGYHFSPQHYLGGIVEDTRQRYDIRDMHYQAYYSGSREDFLKERRRYAGDIASSSYWVNSPDEGTGGILAWTRTHFIDERHHKTRQGIIYRYNGDKTWADLFEVNLDFQGIKLDTTNYYLNCAPYPTADKNCRAITEKVGSQEDIRQNHYKEKHRRLSFKWQKRFDLGFSQHNMQLLTGVDWYKSTHSKQHHIRKVTQGNNTVQKVGGKEIYTPNNVMRHFDGCVHSSGLNVRCAPLVVKGENRFVGLNDKIALGKYVDLGLGGRYDTYSFRSDDEHIINKKHRVWSYNAGIVLKPTENIAASYRHSTGFRVQSFQETFGYLIEGTDGRYTAKSDLAPEKSSSHEVGLSLNNNWGYIDLAYYKSQYRDLIAAAFREDLNQFGYFNFQNISVKGINIQGGLDLNSMWGKVPEGVTLIFGYSRSRPDKVSTNEGLTNGYVYFLDTLQPPKYVLGLNYDSPSEKWGASLTFTHSKAKSEDELKSRYVVKNREVNVAVTPQRTRKWTVVDLTGYWNVNKNITLRAGVYNLMNYRYSMWESVRQTAVGAINQHSSDGNFARYAAPGRNYTASLEMKF
ncbi:hypothetical protein A4G20_04245 [Pasteurellaceae bacterium RH1A]|nr:hypothetical protein A4G20_04245 [Pasteurellaceae bacterium RH1A]